jgi:GT2 family glycosyltransferase
LDISICIPTLNAKHLLRDCLQSIYTNTLATTVEMLRDEFPNVHVIVNDYNAGFSKPTNQALKVSRGRYALLLNNDTIILAAALDKLVEFADTHSQVGICGPKVLNRDGTMQKQCRRSFATPWDLFCYFSGLATVFPSSPFFARYLMTYHDERETHAVDAVSGSCMLIRRAVIDQIGLLDERFFAYQEDTDYCLRAKQNGWQVCYYPRSQIIHFGGMGGAQVNLNHSIYQWHRSYFLYYRKNLASRYPFLFNWFYYFAMFLKFLTALITSAFRKEKFVGSKKP